MYLWNNWFDVHLDLGYKQVKYPTFLTPCIQLILISTIIHGPSLIFPDQTWSTSESKKRHLPASANWYQLGNVVLHKCVGRATMKTNVRVLQTSGKECCGPGRSRMGWKTTTGIQGNKKITICLTKPKTRIFSRFVENTNSAFLRWISLMDRYGYLWETPDDLNKCRLFTGNTAVQSFCGGCGYLFDGFPIQRRVFSPGYLLHRFGCYRFVIFPTHEKRLAKTENISQRYHIGYAYWS